MIGIGTPRKSSKIERPIGFSLLPHQVSTPCVSPRPYGGRSRAQGCSLGGVGDSGRGFVDLVHGEIVQAFVGLFFFVQRLLQ